MSLCCGWRTASQGATAERTAGSSNRAWKRAISSNATAAASAVTPHAAVRERAPLGSQVFEEQGKTAVVGRGCVVGARHSQVEGRGDIGVETRLPLTHTAGTDHLPVGRVQRSNFHEQRRRTRSGRVREADTHPLVRG